MIEQDATPADNAHRARSRAATRSRRTLAARIARFAQRVQLGWMLGVVACTLIGCGDTADGGNDAGGSGGSAADGGNNTDAGGGGRSNSGSSGNGNSSGDGGNSSGGASGSGGNGHVVTTTSGCGVAGCGTGKYCKFALEAVCGATDPSAACETKPDACDSLYKPVCGCDGETYDNDCMAASSGVSVASTGECQGAGTVNALGCNYNGQGHVFGDSFVASDNCNTCTCTHSGVACTELDCSPSSCGSLANTPCPDGEYCNGAGHCGATDHQGTCQALPHDCTEDDAAVCGCDGKTYDNSCKAAALGVSVAGISACDAPANRHCDVGNMHYAVGEMFPDDDGCNRCTCNATGVECTTVDCAPGTRCGGKAGVQCEGEQYCDFPPVTMCGSGDQQGTCRERPDACAQAIAPVCGCDGKNYDSSCDAAVAGASVVSIGTCPFR